jgi:ABC-type molybdate transport system substrate-binding protein
MKRILCAATVAGLAFSTIAARAADITILASNGVKPAVVELAPQFVKETGHKLNFTWGASNLLV